MKLYYISKSDELEHGAIINAIKKATGKYVAKIPTGNGKYRYFYTQEEYAAYVRAKNRENKRQESVGKSRDKAYKKDINRRIKNKLIDKGIYNPESYITVYPDKKKKKQWSYTRKGWIDA